MSASTNTVTIVGHVLDVGSLPAWLSLFFAVLAAAITLRNLKRDREDRRKAQAGKVAAWLDIRRNEPRHLDIATMMNLEMPEPGEVQERGAYISNASELPIRELDISFRSGGRRTGSISAGTLPPHREPMFVSGSRDADEVLIRFRDNLDRTWTRDGQGRLREVRRPWHDRLRRRRR